MHPPAAPQPLTVVFGIDNAFAVPLTATLHSLLDGLSTGETSHCYILSQDITRANRARIERVVGERAHLHWLTLAHLPIDPAFLTTSDHLTLATYYRIFLIELLPPECSKVLYLDADVVVQGDVRALWAQNMGEHVVMAVRDPYVYTVASPKGLRTFQQLGLPGDAPYFNGGVLLIDVDKWRAEGMTQRFLQNSKAYGTYARFGDQDMLNATLHGRWAPLDERWNIQALLVEASIEIPGPASPDQERYVAQLRGMQERLTAGAFIMHYNYRRKPWHPWCKHPYRALFHDHFRRSGCFRSGLGYGSWYAFRHLAWFYKRLTTPRIWKRIWKRTWRTMRAKVNTP